MGLMSHREIRTTQHHKYLAAMSQVQPDAQLSDALVINDILLRATPSVGDTKAASAEKARA